jgi:hypothetical protein
MTSTRTDDGAAFKTPVAGQPTLFLLGPVAQFLATPEQTTEQLRFSAPPLLPVSWFLCIVTGKRNGCSCWRA